MTGYVRNRDDGRVEVLAEGEFDRLGGLGRTLRQGPDLSRVESVEEEERDPAGDRAGFDILHGDRVIG